MSTQGVSGIYVADGNADDRVATPLPPETITRVKPPIATVKSVAQPDASFGGRASESRSAFAQRVSERLRHKNRAVTMWDYERLVLERFPDIHRVKCIDHARLIREGEPGHERIVAEDEMRPGHVLVVPIPKVDPEYGDPRRPYPRTCRLVEIHDFLSERTSPWVELEVVGPRVEEVMVRLDVQLAAGFDDRDFYVSQLDRALQGLLTPWGGADRPDVEFNGLLRKATVIDAVEELPFVSYVENVQLCHRTDIRDDDDAWSGVDHETIRASTARSILVSAARHDIVRVGESR